MFSNERIYLSEDDNNNKQAILLNKYITYVNLHQIIQKIGIENRDKLSSGIATSDNRKKRRSAEKPIAGQEKDEQSVAFVWYNSQS